MQRLLIIRHALAYERDEKRWPDAERPLTPAGKRKFRRVARGLRKLKLDPDVVFTSSLERALQTARILTDEARFHEAIHLAELRPDEPTARLIAALREHSKPLVAVVGHEPALSALISNLLSEAGTVRNRLKKGGIALIEFERRIEAGAGELLLYAPPRLLKRL